jgi:hypothetical protein
MEPGSCVPCQLWFGRDFFSVKYQNSSNYVNLNFWCCASSVNQSKNDINLKGTNHIPNDFVQQEVAPYHLMRFVLNL